MATCKPNVVVIWLYFECFPFFYWTLVVLLVW
jgi:hypothetical protein